VFRHLGALPGQQPMVLSPSVGRCAKIALCALVVLALVCKVLVVQKRDGHGNKNGFSVRRLPAKKKGAYGKGGRTPPYTKKKSAYGKWDATRGRNDTRKRPPPMRPEALQHPLIFMHISKSGGTHVCDMAKAANERPIDVMLGYNNLNCNWKGHDDPQKTGLPESSVSCKSRSSVFRRAHATFGMIEREFRLDADKCPGFIYATILREPLAKLNSARISKPEKIGELETLKQMLGDGTGQDVTNSRSHWYSGYDNVNLRLIANLLTVPAGGVNETHLEQAKYVLQTQFDVVGIAEDLRDVKTASVFFQRLGWNLSTSALATQHNSRSFKKQADTQRFVLQPEDEEWWRKLNIWDIQLYSWAVDKFGIK